MRSGSPALGLKRGDTIAIVGSNRPQLYWSVMAAQALGAVPVPVYADAVADEAGLCARPCRGALRRGRGPGAGRQDSVGAERLPKLEQIVYDEPRGLRDYDHGRLHAIDEVIADGRGALAKRARAWPRGSTARSRRARARTSRSFSIRRAPPASRRAWCCPPSAASMPPPTRSPSTSSPSATRRSPICRSPGSATIISTMRRRWSRASAWPVRRAPTRRMQDMREIGPTFFFAPPRVFEKMLTRVMIRMEDAGRSSGGCFTLSSASRGAMARRSSTASRCRSRAALLYALGEFLVYGPLKNVLGLSRVRIAYTAGEAIGPELFSFYRSLGLNLKQLYGQTEAFLYLTAQPDGKIYADTVGAAMPNVDLRIAENGEVLFKSPGMFVGYFKDEAKTAEVMTAGRLGEDRRCRLHRSQDRPSQDHRPRQGRRPAQRRHAVRAEIHREQAQVLSQHPRGGGATATSATSSARMLNIDLDRGRELGRAQQHRLWLLSGAGRRIRGSTTCSRSTSRR